MLNKLTKSGYLLIRIITAIFATLFLIYSLFTLWDMYRTEIKAFASYDLLKYRPNIEEDEPPYLDELLQINPDVAGWVTIYGTNIDYPVMKGKDDTEYLNKTALNEYSVSGSIFMSMLNKKDFSDPYTLIYGHHMANGSMFGDIDKFKNKKFFYNTKNCRYKEDEGVLIMENIVYNLKVFAIIETNAYDGTIYHSNKTQEEIPTVINYLKTNGKYFIDLKNNEKILALSTCDINSTDGRTILFCRMELRTDPLPTREAEPLTPHRQAQGHPMAGAYWGLLNLLSLLIIIFAIIRIFITKTRRQALKDKNALIVKISIIEISLLLLSILLFILTEDLHKPIQIIDIWTLPMILILAGIYLAEQYSINKAKFLNNKAKTKEIKEKLNFLKGIKKKKPESL